MSRNSNGNNIGFCGSIIVLGLVITLLKSVVFQIALFMILLCLIIALVKEMFFSEQVIQSIDIDDIDRMTGKEFEEYVARLLEDYGYQKVAMTPTSGDDGIDIIAYRGNTKIGFQCKCYRNNIGNSAVQQAYTGKAMHNCDEAVVVTNAYFTNSAIKTAETTNVELWDRQKLIQMNFTIGNGETRVVKHAPTISEYIMLILSVAGFIAVSIFLFRPMVTATIEYIDRDSSEEVSQNDDAEEDNTDVSVKNPSDSYTQPYEESNNLNEKTGNPDTQAEPNQIENPIEDSELIYSSTLHKFKSEYNSIAHYPIEKTTDNDPTVVNPTFDLDGTYIYFSDSYGEDWGDEGCYVEVIGKKSDEKTLLVCSDVIRTLSPEASEEEINDFYNQLCELPRYSSIYLHDIEGMRRFEYDKKGYYSFAFINRQFIKG